MKIRESSPPQFADSHSANEGAKVSRCQHHSNERLGANLSCDTPFFAAHDLLNQLALNIRTKSYSLDHPSKELIRDFIIGIEVIRSNLL